MFSSVCFATKFGTRYAYGKLEYIDSIGFIIDRAFNKIAVTSKGKKRDGIQ